MEYKPQLASGSRRSSSRRLIEAVTPPSYLYTLESIFHQEQKPCLPQPPKKHQKVPTTHFNTPSIPRNESPHFQTKTSSKSSKKTSLKKKIKALEEENKKLFDRYNKNEKKQVKILKQINEDHQSLLQNLKKLLGKSVIDGKTLLSNPSYHKFLKKLQGLQSSNAEPDLFVSVKSSQEVVAPKSLKSKKSEETENQRMTKNVNSYLVNSMHADGKHASWISALYYSNIAKKLKI